MVRMIAASRACLMCAFWGVSLLAVGDVCAGLSAIVAIVIASSTLIPVAWPRPRACASMLRLMPFRAVSAERKSIDAPVCLAMNLIAVRAVAIDAGLFSLRCRWARYPLIWSDVIGLSWKRVAICISAWSMSPLVSAGCSIFSHQFKKWSYPASVEYLGLVFQACV